MVAYLLLLSKTKCRVLLGIYTSRSRATYPSEDPELEEEEELDDSESSLTLKNSMLDAEPTATAPYFQRKSPERPDQVAIGPVCLYLAKYSKPFGEFDGPPVDFTRSIYCTARSAI